MIADHENIPDAVYLDGKPLDLAITTMADDERGVVEQIVFEKDDNGQHRIATWPNGMPKTVELRGDVRIIFPATPRKPN